MSDTIIPVALVTGASRGIGKATAVALAASGFDVAVTARTVREGQGVDDSDALRRPVPGSLETTAALVAATGRRALPIPMNLLERASLDAAVQQVFAAWRRIDLLVNNAIYTGPGNMTVFDDTSLDVIEAALSANVVAQVVVIKGVLPHMLQRGSGVVINVTSAVAINGPAAPAGQGGWGCAYAMSKGAFHRLAGILAVEYRERGIRFYNLEPGFVHTERMEANARALGLEGAFRGAPRPCRRP